LPSTATTDLALGAKQELFAQLLARLIQWIALNPGWRVRMGESRILPLGPDGKGRRARHVLTGLPVRVRDLVHMENGLHYQGLAADLNLFVYSAAHPNGEYITSSEHPAWRAIGAWWEALHPLCRWGGRFGDANHISLTHGGKS
jgi:hypothetical protein